MNVMAIRQGMCGGLLLMGLASTSGRGSVQDPDQPAVGLDLGQGEQGR